jgi:predicted nucleic acid-binding protein
MRFWDASAIVPMLLEEVWTPQAQALADVDSDMFVWWGSKVECVSAVSRVERTSPHEAKAIAIAYDRLNRLAERWHEVEPSEVVREAAIRLLRVHPLRAADALQLAAAFVAADQRPASLAFVTFDERLALAAAKEGFILAQTS